MTMILLSKSNLLSLAVILGAFSIGIYWLHYKDYSGNRWRFTADGRNEHSTPRSFVLPATPAVAFEQEMRAADHFSTTMSKHEITGCMVRLIDLGYDVGDEAVPFNAKLSEALYEYQKKNGLKATGKFDPLTVRSLSCSAK
jgi:hypothetical protein